jgi:CheY-like chemotaxis protein
MADDILIVDDEADIRELVSGILQDEGFITRSARDSDDALAHVASRRPNLVFLDIWLQGSRLDGLQLLDAMKGQHPSADRDDLRPRQHRDRGLRDQAGRLRFHREAVQGRPPGAGRPACARNLAAQAQVKALKQFAPSTWSASRRR